jgi:ribosomal protein L11 methyltransferase
MSPSYFLKITPPPGTGSEQREVLSTVLTRAATRFSFRGLEDWAVNVPASQKILGAEREFHDLSGLKRTSETFVVYFGSRSDAATYGKILKNAFAELSISAPRKQAKQDWMKAWRKHYKTVKIRAGGVSLAIVPAWKKAPATGISVRIYPGQAFGTGTHATTRLCMELYLVHRREGGAELLDFGAGTGILAFAALKLAASEKVRVKALAVESDPEALAQAGKNARINRLKIGLSRKMNAGKRYEIIFANVLAPVLLAQKTQLLGGLKKGGLIILSGILRKECAKFLKEFRSPALELVEERSEGDWVAFALRKK